MSAIKKPTAVATRAAKAIADEWTHVPPDYYLAPLIDRETHLPELIALIQALQGVAPSWDVEDGYCYCSSDAFHDDDGESIPHDGYHEPACARARRVLALLNEPPDASA